MLNSYLLQIVQLFLELDSYILQKKSTLIPLIGEKRNCKGTEHGLSYKNLYKQYEEESLCIFIKISMLFEKGFSMVFFNFIFAFYGKLDIEKIYTYCQTYLDSLTKKMKPRLNFSDQKESVAWSEIQILAIYIFYKFLNTFNQIQYFENDNILFHIFYIFADVKFTDFFDLIDAREKAHFILKNSRFVKITKINFESDFFVSKGSSDYVEIKFSDLEIPICNFRHFGGITQIQNLDIEFQNIFKKKLFFKLIIDVDILNSKTFILKKCDNVSANENEIVLFYTIWEKQNNFVNYVSEVKIHLNVI